MILVCINALDFKIQEFLKLKVTLSRTVHITFLADHLFTTVHY